MVIMQRKMFVIEIINNYFGNEIAANNGNREIEETEKLIRRN